MAIEIPDFDTLRARYLQQVANQQPQAATGPDSDHYVRASAVAAAVESLHQHIWWLGRQQFPDSADPDYLERRHASLYGLARNPASTATGTVTLTGAPDTPVSAGLLLQAANGQQYEVTENSAIGGGGTVDVAAWALLAGPDANLAAAAPLTIVIPVAGITSAVVATMDGGNVSEGDDSLRDRVKERMRNAPAGGNKADYERWAKEVPGVGRAWCLASRRGLGTVDVAIMALDGLPSAGLIEAVEDYIQDRRPVTSDVLVLQPDLVVVNITATVMLSGVSLASAQAAAATAIAAYVDQLAPGDTVYLSRLSAAIQDVPGVVNVVITSPVADVDTSVDALHLELAQMGTLTLGV